MAQNVKHGDLAIGIALGVAIGMGLDERSKRAGR